MQNKTVTLITTPVVWIAVILILFQFAPPVRAEDYAIVWSTIDGGGGRSSGGPYTLVGTIGQPDAAWSSGGGNYELLGGFWPGGPICIVAFDDFARFAQLWRLEGTGLAADLDGSGHVDFDDLGEFADLWLSCCPVGWPLK